jgi:rhodanese-related sulfurtransferase
MSISPLELKMHLIHDDVILIDVRESVEYNIEHIEGTLLLPLSLLSLSELPTTHKKIVFYCAAGIRSQKACLKISQEDDSIEVLSLDGGIQAWKQAGLPVTTTSYDA